MVRLPPVHVRVESPLLNIITYCVYNYFTGNYLLPADMYFTNQTWRKPNDLQNEKQPI